MEQINNEKQNKSQRVDFARQNNKDFLKYKSYCKLLGINEGDAKSLERYNKIANKLTIYLIPNNEAIKLWVTKYTQTLQLKSLQKMTN